MRLANLRAGDLDFAERILASDVAGLKADPHFKVMVGPSMQYNAITINIANGTGGNPDFQKSAQLREALDLSIDRDAINQVLFDGNGVPDNQPVAGSQPLPFAGPADEAARHRARQGAGQGERRRASEPRADGRQLLRPAQLAQMLQSMAAEAGIDIKLRTLEFQTLLAQQAKGDYQASLIGWSGRVDPDGNIYTLLGCKSPTNDARYCRRGDGVPAAARPGGDRQPRGAPETLSQAIDKIVDDRPIIYLYHPPLIMAMTAKLTGFAFHPDGLIRLQDVSYAP